MLNILIVDESEIVRRGLENILQKAFDHVQTGEATNSTTLIEKLIERNWNLLLLNPSLPGLNIEDTLIKIREQQPNLPVVIVSEMSKADYAMFTIRSGANGYVTKQCAAEEFVTVVKKVLAGETGLSANVIKDLATIAGGNPLTPHEKLSPRETEIFRAIARGRTPKEIAGELGLSEKTVGTYIARIREKTGLNSYVEFTRYALQYRLVE